MDKQVKIINGFNSENFDNKNSKIINGFKLNEKLKKKYDFFGSITLANSNIPGAGASYIGNNIVVTAGHVANEFKNRPQNIVVRFNKKNLYDNGIKFKVKKILIHPKYNTNTFDNDIALLYLDDKPSKYGIKNIFLPGNRINRSTYVKNKNVTIIGYGVDRFFRGRQPYNLQASNIKIMNKYETKYPSYWITKNMFPAGDWNDLRNPSDNEDSCQGDSGGPLFGNYGRNNEIILLGITSWGKGCGWDSYPGIYTKTGNYTNWIYNNWNLNK